MSADRRHMGTSVERLRKLLANSTPGPWEVIPESDDGYVVGQYNERWPQPLQDPVGRFGEPDARLIALAPDAIALLADAADALDKGKRFERAYQESLGATPTVPQWERLDSLQSAFLDAYLDVLDRLAALCGDER